MEGRKHSGSSFASDLFGEKEGSAAASSSGFFSSIFAQPTTRGLGKELFSLSETQDKMRKKKKNDSASDAWNVKNRVSGENGVGGQEQSWSTNSKETTNPYYNEEGNVQPFHYSSSIYYGGQDVYSQPKKADGITTFSKDIEDDDSGSASRGNWWQGSLYY